MYKLVQLVKLLLGKQKRLKLRSHERKLDMVVCVCSISAVEAETKASRGSLVSEPTYLVSSRPGRDLLHNKQGRWLLRRIPEVHL